MKYIFLLISVASFIGCAAKEKSADAYVGVSAASGEISIPNTEALTEGAMALNNHEWQFGSSDSYGIFGGKELNDRFSIRALYNQTMIGDKVKNQFFGLGADFRIIGELRFHVLPGVDRYLGYDPRVFLDAMGSDPFTSFGLLYGMSYDFFITPNLSLAFFFQGIRTFRQPSVTVIDLLGAHLRYWF